MSGANEKLHDPMEKRPTPEDASFAQHVTTALHRVGPSDGFTDRVMARAALQTPWRPDANATPGGHRGVLLQFTRPAWRAVYAAAAVLAITAGMWHVEHMRMEQRRADEAAAQLDTALQVTHHALDKVSAKLETTQFGEIQRALEANGGGK